LFYHIIFEMSTIQICPECFEEDVYFNGINYECSGCGLDWIDKQTNASPYNYEQEEFERLIKLKEPYFQLEHGKLYECDVELGGGKFDKTTFIPLAFHEGRNEQFILTDARKLLKQYPQIVNEIINMRFLDIWNDGLADYPSEFKTMAAVFATQREGTGLDDSGVHYYEIIKTNEL